MGIQGLLLALKPYCGAEGNVRDFAGQAVAIDTSSWLHKSVYSIADHYVECIESSNSNGNSGTVDAKCIHTSAQYVIQRCQELLQGAGIRKLYLVLDGTRCPLKAATNQERDRKRRENLAAARRFRFQQQQQNHSNSNSNNTSNKQQREKQMHEKYRACIRVTDELVEAVAARVQQKFAHSSHQNNKNGQPVVEIVWSPYEADAELVQLCIDGRCAAVITEDSDVLVYSAACSVSFPILYKLDRHTGACDVVSMDWLLLQPASDEFKKTTKQASNNNNNHSNKNINTKHQRLQATANGAAEGKEKRNGENSGSQLEAVLGIFAARQATSPGWGARLFVQACVLAGCDYAPRQLPGVGLVTAFKYVRNAGLTGSPANLANVFHQILVSQLPAKSRGAVPDLAAFEVLLAQSEAVFYYHPVALASGQVMHLNDPHPVPEAATGRRPRQGHHHAPSLERFHGEVSFLGSLVANRNSRTGIIPNPQQQQHPSSHFFHKRNKVAGSSSTSPSHLQQPKRPHLQQQQNQHQCNTYTTTVPTLVHATRVVVGGSFSSLVTSPSVANEPPCPTALPASHNVVMANPYQQHNGKNHLHHRRHNTMPLQLQSPNVTKQKKQKSKSEKDGSSEKAKPLNPFEVYARRHREQGIEQSNKIVTAKLPVRSSTQTRNATPEKRKTFRTEDNDDVRFVKRSFPKDGSKAVLPETKRHKMCPSLAVTGFSRSSAAGQAHAEDESDEFVESPRHPRTMPARNKSNEHRSKFFDMDDDDDPFGAKDAAKRRRRRTVRSPIEELLEKSYSATTVVANDELDEEVDLEPLTVKSLRLLRGPVLNFSLGMHGRNDGTLQHRDTNASSYDTFEGDANAVSGTESQPLLSPQKAASSSHYFDYDGTVTESPDLLNDSENMFQPSPNLLEGSGPKSEVPNRLSSDDMFDPKQHQQSPRHIHSSCGRQDSSSSHFCGQWPSHNPCADQNGFSRRVTLENAPENVASKLVEASHAELFLFAGTNGHSSTTNAQTSSRCNFYDQIVASPAFIGSKEVVDLCGDELEETSPDKWKVTASQVTSRLSRQPPKEKSTIGPAKTLRYRFGSSADLASNVTKKKKDPNILQRIFQQQRNLSSQSASAAPSKSRRAPLSYAIGSAKRKKIDPNQTTLLAHFSTRDSQPDVDYL